MSPQDLPERLLAANGDEFERRLISAIAAERPSTDLRARMAQAIGIPAGALAQGMTEPAHADVVGSKVGTAAVAGSKSSAVLVWSSAGALILALAGVIFGIHRSSAPPVVSAPVTSVSTSAPAVPPAASVEDAPPSTVQVSHETAEQPAPKSARPRASADDLRAQIALIDSARSAVSASAGTRALELLRQYHEKYPSGVLRPEAAALKVEALVKLGRTTEARALAKRFVAEYGESPQSDRVMRIANPH